LSQDLQYWIDHPPAAADAGDKGHVSNRRLPSGTLAVASLMHPTAHATVAVGSQPMTQPGEIITLERMIEIDEMTNQMLQTLLAPRPTHDLVKERSTLMQLPFTEADFFVDRKRTALNYTVLLRVMRERKLLQEGLALFADMQQRGVKPIEPTYVALIGLCGSSRAATRVENSALKDRIDGLVAHSVDTGVPLTHHTIANVVLNYCRLGFVDDAADTLRTLDTTHPEIAPNAVMYTSVINALTKSGRDQDVEVAWDLYQDMINAEVKLDGVAFNQLLRLCGQHGEVERAIEIHDDMREESVLPSLYTFSNLIYAVSQRFEYFHKASETLCVCV
jgi:pentatricopeptide repeat protein